MDSDPLPSGSTRERGQHDATSSPAAGPQARDGCCGPREESSRPAWRSSSLRVGIKLIIGPVLLVMVFNRLPMGNVIEVLREARLTQCLLGYLLLFVVSALQGLQIAVAMPDRPRALSLPRLVRLHFISCFYAVLLPTAVTQSLVKWHRLSQGVKLRAQSAAIVIYLRAVNIAAMILLAMSGLLFDKQVSEACPRSLSCLLLVVALLCTMPMLSHRLSQRVGTVVGRLSRPFPVPRFVRDGVFRIWSAILAINTMSYVRRLAVFLSGIAYLSIGAVAFYFLASSVRADLGIAALLWLQFVLFIVSVLPVSVLGLGIREATLVSVLPRLYGTAPASALAVSLLILGWHIFALIAGGACEAYEAIMVRQRKQG
jgi:glycosyltransferase 2 family protein